MNYQALSNRALVKHISKHPHDDRGWNEFVRRFDDYIHLVALRECRKKIARHEKNQLPEIVRDRAAEAYERLCIHDCKALRAFVGDGEKSIYTYLAVITHNTVMNWVKREHGPNSRPIINESLEALLEETPHTELVTIIQQFGYVESGNGIALAELHDKIEKILNRHLRGREFIERNKIIFKLHFFEGFSPQEIVESLPYNISLKRVENIIWDLKKSVKENLIKEEIQPG